MIIQKGFNITREYRKRMKKPTSYTNLSERISNKDKLGVVKPVLISAVFALFIVLCVSPAAASHGANHPDIPGEWEEIGSLRDLSNVNHSGNYYLSTDLGPYEQWNIPEGLDITLCLNGHVLSQYSPGNSVIEIPAGASNRLTICDCGNERHYFNINKEDIWVLAEFGKTTPHYLDGGVIIGGQHGGVGVGAGATFILSGGNIVGNMCGVYLENNAKFTMSGGSIVGNKVDRCGGGVHVGNGATFIMSGGNIAKNKGSYGGGVGVENGAFTMSGGSIVENKAIKYGGGVYSDGCNPIEISGNALIKNNTAGDSGGGMYIRNTDVTLTSSDVSITGNKAIVCGGGIYTCYGGKLILSDGKITYNTAQEGAGVYENSCDITLCGTEISGNKAVNHGSSLTSSYNGGGMYLSFGKLTMTDGSITANTAETDGGGVVVSSMYTEFIMKGGSISGNTASKRGGGVYDDGTSYMTGGIITGNKAEKGAGMYLYSSRTTLSGGSITGNHATESGGGVYDYFSQHLTLSGDIIIKDNTMGGAPSNVYLYGNSKFTVGESGFGENAHIGVLTQHESPVYIAAGSTAESAAAAANHIFADKENEAIITEGTALKLIKYYNWMSGDPVPASPGYYKLIDNITLSNVWSVPAGGTTYLDLNGYWLKQNAFGGSVIKINSGSTLNILDSRPTQTTHRFKNVSGVWKLDESGNAGGDSIVVRGGVITGGSVIENGGGVSLNGGSLIMNGGTVIGNKANMGGGVDVYGTGGSFNLNGGKITHNTAKSYGGGVHVGSGSLFTVNGGSITENSANAGGGVNVNYGKFKQNGGSIAGNTAHYGGGVNINHGSFNQNGGSIADNTATSNGGGVAVQYDSFTLKSGSITGNNAKDGGGVYAYGSSHFTMSGGRISNNNASKGTGVYVLSGGKFIMEGGDVIRNNADAGFEGGGVYVPGANDIILSGDAKVQDNFAGDIKRNVYLGNGAAITLDRGGLINGAYIGVSTQTSPTYNNKITVVVSGASAKSAACVHADKPNEDIVLENGALKLRLIPTITKATLMIQNNIDVIFKTPSYVAEQGNPTIDITFNKTHYALNPEAARDGDGNYVFVFKNISPYEMTVPIKAQLYVEKDGKPATPLGEPVVYSVETYCLSMLKKTPGEGATDKLKTLCVDLLYYGAAAQTYIGDTNPSATAKLTEEDKARRTAVDPSPRYHVSISESGDDTVGKWKAGTLNLYSNISVMAYFKSSIPPQDLEAEVWYGPKDNRKQTNVCELSSGRIKISSIDALDLNYPLEITLKSKSDKSLRSKTLVYGADAYYYHAKETGVEDNLMDLVTNTIKYIRSVENYSK